MNLLRFLRSEAPRTLRVVLVLSAITGLASVALVALVNTAASVEGIDAEGTEGEGRLVVLFSVALLILTLSKYHGMFRLMATVEDMLEQMQVRICDKIRRTDLQTMESLDQSRIFTAVSQNTRIVSQSIIGVSAANQHLFVMVFGLIYLAWLSPPALILYVVSAAIAFYYHRKRAGALLDAYLGYADKGAQFFDYLSHLLYGIKELRLNRDKNDDLFEDLKEVASSSKEFAMKTNLAFAREMVLTDVTMYLLTGAVVFLLPQIVPTYSEVLTKATIAVIFSFTPVIAVVSSGPQFATANAGLDALYKLEDELDLALADLPKESLRGTFDEFSSIRLDNVTFCYEVRDDATPFSIGPVNLEIRRQETLFIVGGNGSGKSTLLKVLTGLYRPDGGSIQVDHQQVTAENRDAFCDLFAGVFTDFRLFPRLYGLRNPDPDKIRTLLHNMEIGHKVEIVNGRFSTLKLSTGQRKRLALLTCLLEDRQIYIFDEWTADQDPSFRERFYSVILPDLKKRGKTVIAITHDDRYWGTADRIVKLDYGMVESIS